MNLKKIISKLLVALSIIAATPMVFLIAMNIVLNPPAWRKDLQPALIDWAQELTKMPKEMYMHHPVVSTFVPAAFLSTLLVWLSIVGLIFI